MINATFYSSENEFQKAFSIDNNLTFSVGQPHYIQEIYIDNSNLFVTGVNRCVGDPEVIGTSAEAVINNYEL